MQQNEWQLQGNSRKEMYIKEEEYVNSFLFSDAHKFLADNLALADDSSHTTAGKQAEAQRACLHV